MADFRKWFLVLAVVALLVGTAGTASAQQALSCTSNAGVPPIIRAEGLAELVGDVVLNCTGGNFTQSFQVNWQIFLNTNITSRILALGSFATRTEALLMIDEPTSSTINVEEVAGPVIGNGDNTFIGRQAAANSIVWLGIPFTPPGTAGVTRIVRISNVRANANQLGVSSTLIPTTITMYISASGSQSIPINNPQQTVAYIQPGLQFALSRCGDPSLGAPASFTAGLQCVGAGSANVAGLRFTEGFATAFKKKVDVGQNPSTPGVVFNTESGFVNESALGTEIGNATQGTRLMARFSNVPAGVTINVATENSIWLAATSALPTVTASLTTTDAAGAGSYSAVTKTTSTTLCGTASAGVGMAPVTLSGGAGMAVWEVTASNPFANEVAVFPMNVAWTANTTNNLPGLGTATVTGNFAPISTVTTMSATAPVPRFADNPVSRTLFTINACVTNLLFPFVTNQAGLDTGIAISNTSLDIFLTPTQAGACKINYFGQTTGGGAAPAAQTSQTVKAGETLLASLSTGGTHGVAATPGFQGYIIAQCFFQYAHGFAFISDLGLNKYAEGYLALVMDLSQTANRTGSSSESLNN